MISSWYWWFKSSKFFCLNFDLSTNYLCLQIRFVDFSPLTLCFLTFIYYSITTFYLLLANHTSGLLVVIVVVSIVVVVIVLVASAVVVVVVLRLFAVMLIAIGVVVEKFGAASAACEAVSGKIDYSQNQVNIFYL